MINIQFVQTPNLFAYQFKITILEMLLIRDFSVCPYLGRFISLKEPETALIDLNCWVSFLETKNQWNILQLINLIGIFQLF